MTFAQCQECGLRRKVGQCPASKEVHCLRCCKTNGDGLTVGKWKPLKTTKVRTSDPTKGKDDNSDVFDTTHEGGINE